MTAYYAVVGSEQTSECLTGTNSYYLSTASSPYTSSFEAYPDDLSLASHVDESVCNAASYYTHWESPYQWNTRKGRPLINPMEYSYVPLTARQHSDFYSASNRNSPKEAPSACSSLSPRSSTQDSACDEDLNPTTSLRKRGRPRTRDMNAPSQDTGRSACLPHKQVERKYREGLNMEFERLRRAVPTLPQGKDANVMGTSKPSKGMVLAAAIDYIGSVERERDAVRKEVEVLRMLM